MSMNYRDTTTIVTFRTKAETLGALSSRLTTARVLPLAQFTVTEWRRRAPAIVAGIADDWPDSTLIVRSSAIAEDNAGGSLAGHFRTVTGVRGADALRAAIEDVIASYGDMASAADRVLVQPMLDDVALSGVAFSHDPNTGAPYIVVNYTAGRDTAAVTGGGAGAVLKTAFLWRDAPERPPQPLRAVAELIAELEDIFAGASLDVEFAQDATGVLYLFQVRPLAIRKPAAIARADQTAVLAAIAAKVDTANQPHPYLHGQQTAYGIMPDWNPAEIIGVRPRPLALSLYREIITDAIWAYQRHNYGYKNLRSFPLLLDFYGLPYVDVRVSFNSFVPADVPDELAGRLVDYYLQRLLDAPQLHDKVEFEIVLSCYAFDIDRKLAALHADGFSAEDIAVLRSSVHRLTNRIIHRDTGLWRADLDRVETLVARHDAVSTSALDTVSRIYWLLEDCKRYGTLPFAGLARAGFIGVQILRSLVSVGVLSDADRATFMSGLGTVSSRMGHDIASLDRETFLAIYGHLRPGTYDILSPRYDAAPDRYFDWSRPGPATPAAPPAFALSLGQMRDIEHLLTRHAVEQDVVGLFGFLEAGIRGREYSKFVFSRSLSDALELIAQLGAEHGFSRDDMSYADIRAVYGLYAGAANVRRALADSIARGREAYACTTAIALPPLLTAGDDVWSFEMPPTDPNFVTLRRVSAPVARVDAGGDLAGKIALIASADPGYDWILSRGIAGFVTAYGGVNSHMAIRASELDLPAVIGAGEVLFSAWAAAEVLEIDAANRQVLVIR